MSDNKQYYYMKLKEGFFDTDEIKILESMENGYLYCNILLKLYLRSLRSEGRLMYKNIIPYTPEIISSLVGHPADVIEKALEVFKQLGLVEILDNGAIFMLDIQNFIGKSSTEADRQRAYQNKIKRERDAIALDGTIEKELRIPEQKKEENAVEAPKARRQERDPDFEEFWKVYPRKEDKGSAYKKYNARRKDGFSPEELLEAAKNYAAQCEREKTERKYIKLGKTFLSDSTPFMDFLNKNAPMAYSEVTEADIEGNPYRRNE